MAMKLAMILAQFDPKKSPLIKLWQDELREKQAAKGTLDREYYKLRDEIKHASTNR
ncbi:MAG: hypothetical protein LBU58_07870 [Clostridiales bacterium]|jgi:hypothetical protein|nr:hypothetical protein [Clostridiales bacterium]